MKKATIFGEGIGPGLVYLAFRAAAWLAEHAPLKAGEWAASVGAAIAFRLAKRKREIVRRNLARVVGGGPQLDNVTREAFYSYARYWLETFRLGRYSREDLIWMVQCDSLNVLEEALGAGDGVVVVTAHFGFYDLGVARLGVGGYPMTTVAEVLRPRALFEWFADIRRRRGMDVIPARPKDEALRSQEKIITSGDGVALLAERNLGRRGVWVEFFGEKTTFPVGPPLLVAKTGAALLSGAIYQVGERFRLDFEEIPYRLTGDESADVEVVAQVIAGAVERIVRKAPEQWHLFSTNWPSDEGHLPPRGAVPIES